MSSVLQGIGLIAKSITDILVTTPPNYVLAVQDLLLGLGQFGLHTAIVKAMAEEKSQEAQNVQKQQKDTNVPIK